MSTLAIPLINPMKEYTFLARQLQDLLSRAIEKADDGGKEICGLLIDNGFFLELLSVRNKHKGGGGFAFYSQEIRKIQSATNVLEHEIVGTFHSHPLYIGKPSKGDIEDAVDDSLMLIIDVTDKKAVLWHIEGSIASKVHYSLIEEAWLDSA